MINLLPEEDKNLIKKEYSRRLGLVIGIASFIFICVAIIFLAPSYFLLSSEKNISREQISLALQRFDRENAQKIETEITDFNAELVSFSQKEEGLALISPDIRQILKARSNSIKIEGISYQRKGASRPNGVISLRGTADNRNSLLSFMKNLEAAGGVKRVESPASNLLKENNISFVLIITLINGKQ